MVAVKIPTHVAEVEIAMLGGSLGMSVDEQRKLWVVILLKLNSLDGYDIQYPHDSVSDALRLIFVPRLCTIEYSLLISPSHIPCLMPVCMHEYTSRDTCF